MAGNTHNGMKNPGGSPARGMPAPVAASMEIQMLWPLMSIMIQTAQPATYSHVPSTVRSAISRMRKVR